MTPCGEAVWRLSLSEPCSLLCSKASIHAEAPDFVEMNVKQEILVTGIKVVDLLAPYAKGGKIGEEEGQVRGSGQGLTPAPLCPVG